MKKIEIKYKEPGGIIWKILPDEQGDHLVVESRDGTRRKTILSILNLTGNDFLYTTEELPKSWWIGLVAVEADKIVFQGYKESNSPEPKGYYSFELKTGKLLESKEEEIYEFSSADEKDEITFFPLLYNEDNPHYTTIISFLKNNNGYTVVGPLEYMEHGKNVLISFYIQENKKMTNILLVLDEEGNTLLEDKLIEGAEGVGLASFFICKSKLIYVKNKTSIALADL